MIDVFRGYVKTKNKKPAQKFANGEKLFTIEQANNCEEYAGILNGEYTVLDFDTKEDGDIAYKIVQDENLNVRVIQTTRGKHIIFKNTPRIRKGGVGLMNAIGLTFDIRYGKNMYIVLKNNGKVREVIRDFDETKEIDQVPVYFVPILDGKDFKNLQEGDGRNQQLFSHMITLKKSGLSNDGVLKAIELINDYCLKDPLPEKELKTLCRREAVENINVTTAIDDFGNPVLRPKEYTDLAMARLFASHYIEEMRYNPATDWLVWNGKYWEMGELAAQEKYTEFLDKVLQCAKNEVNIAYKETDIGAKKNDTKIKDAEKFFGFVLKMSDAGKISSVLKLARAFMQVEISDLDKDPFELNTPDGIIDLRTGVMKEHAAKSMCTRITNYSPGRDGEKEWQDFLDVITVGDAELKKYLQAVAGAIAIGKVYTEALVIAFGGGQNGKSSLFNTMFEVLGDYSGKIPAESLTTKVKNAKVDLAELLGKRYILASETEEGQRLSISMLKQIASVDRISAEKKYHDPFSFIPSHTIILYTNFLPRVGSIDDGTWRRIKVAPFSAVIKNPKKDFAEKLLEKSAKAVMKWIVEGAKMFIDNGYDLPDCKVVTNAITTYKEENNWIENFLNDCCVLDDKEKVAGGVLFKVYRQWANEVGEYPRRNRDFAEALKNLGYMSKRNEKGVLWYGLNINPDRNFAKGEEFL